MDCTAGTSVDGSVLMRGGGATLRILEGRVNPFPKGVFIHMHASSPPGPPTPALSPTSSKLTNALPELGFFTPHGPHIHTLL